MYTYRATDSITGEVYSWSHSSSDTAGDFYPGPNEPRNIVQTGKPVWDGNIFFNDEGISEITTDFPVSIANGVATLDPFNWIPIPEWRKKSAVSIALSGDTATLVDNLDADGLYTTGFVPPYNHTYAALYTARLTIKADSGTDCAWVDVSAPIQIVCGEHGVVQFNIDPALAVVSTIGATSLLLASASVSAASAMAWSFNLKAIRPPGVACTVVRYDQAVTEIQKVA